MPSTQEDKYAANQWGSSDIGGLTDLTVPSGQLCLVRRPGVEGLLAAGVLRDIDSLTAIVAKEHIERVEGKGRKKPQDRRPKAEIEVKSDEEVLRDLMADPDKLVNVMHTIDRVLTHVVVKPELLMAPNDATSRKPGKIYTDMIDMTDKMFIFNFAVGGSSDLDSFREEFESTMGSLGAGAEAEGEAE